jgi:hypothetical protein
MIRYRAACVALFVLLGPVVPARADVIVSFEEPRRFTDAGPYGADVERSFASIEQHVKTLGARCIRLDRRLAVRFHDIDLTGYRDWRGANGLRVMRDVTWPRMNLSYTLRDSEGAIIGERRERLAHMNYLSRAVSLRNPGTRTSLTRRCSLRGSNGDSAAGDARSPPHDPITPTRPFVHSRLALTSG